jgi:hypothetical protein
MASPSGLARRAGDRAHDDHCGVRDSFGGLVTAGAIAFGLGAKDLARDVLQPRFRPAPENRGREDPDFTPGIL